MCTLIVSFQQHPAAPLIVAANRDELLERPASPPHRWANEPFIAPKDEQAGGTWLGLNRHGLFVGVTNRFPSERHPERDSRGQLVLEALRAPSAHDLRRTLERLHVTRFNTFHLLYADAHSGFVTWSDDTVIRHTPLEPGLHVVTERSLGGDDHGRTALIEDTWPSVPRVDDEPTLEGLQSLLRLKRPDDPAGGVCVELPGVPYGTRSSFILKLRTPVSSSQLQWAEGPPDRTPFVDRAELIATLA